MNVVAVKVQIIFRVHKDVTYKFWTYNCYLKAFSRSLLKKCLDQLKCLTQKHVIFKNDYYLANHFEAKKGNGGTDMILGAAWCIEIYLKLASNCKIFIWKVHFSHHFPCVEKEKALAPAGFCSKLHDHCWGNGIDDKSESTVKYTSALICDTGCGRSLPKSGSIILGIFYQGRQCWSNLIELLI